ncbi:MAG: aspartate-semialdehyde dehydrogenase [bacterium]|nr:aspartate-semialdehyde dehydrogenase [bacterium]
MGNKPHRIGILGATGLVGQRLVQLLEGHPWFHVRAVGASERSAGRAYADATSWRLPSAMPAEIAGLEVRRCRAADFDDCTLVFSGLDSPVAREAEPDFAAAGHAVVSNSSAYRQAVDVPLLIPEVNPEHLGLLTAQRRRTGGGYIVTNPNCSTIGLALAVAPLHEAFGIKRMVVTTLQAISGAGAEGPRALEMLDNVVPFIPGEEDKLEIELAKILGRVGDGCVSFDGLVVSAHCHRVSTVDGHLEAVSVELEGNPSPDDVGRVLETYRGKVGELGLPSSPERPIVLRHEPDRPQPRLDRDTGNGMAVVVGRVRCCRVLGIKFELLSHNTLRGAAGGTLLNAELLAKRGLLVER